MATGAGIFSAAVGYVVVHNQLDSFWQISSISVLGFFVILWTGAFGTPTVRSVWRASRKRLGTDSTLAPRVEAMESRLKQLDEQSQLQLIMISLLEFSMGTNVVLLMNERISREQFIQRLRVALQTAHTLAQGLNTMPKGQEFRGMLSSSLDLLIVMGAGKQVPFQTIASMAIDGLTLPIAKQIISVSIIIEAYGMDSASKWRSMVGL